MSFSKVLNFGKTNSLNQNRKLIYNFLTGKYPKCPEDCPLLLPIKDLIFHKIQNLTPIKYKGTHRFTESNELWNHFFFRSFGLTQKNQKVKTQQSSSRTRPDAGPLLCRPPRLSDAGFVVKKEIKMRNGKTKIKVQPFCFCFVNSFLFNS